MRRHGPHLRAVVCSGCNERHASWGRQERVPIGVLPPEHQGVGRVHGCEVRQGVGEGRAAGQAAVSTVQVLRAGPHAAATGSNVDEGLRNECTA